MAKKGAKRHLKRIASPSAVALSDKKHRVFYIKAHPGPAPLRQAVPAGSLLRDLLGYAATLSEAKKILNSGKVFVDGKKINDVHFPIGLMAGIYLKDEEKYYRMLIEKGALVPEPIDKDDYALKKLKVIRKYRGKKGEITVCCHDGRVLKGDKAISVGDTIVLDLKSGKLKGVLNLKEGVDVLITAGKHAGVKAKLKAITRHGHTKEAVLESNGQELITRAEYVMVV
ncbi:MAG: S4 domain-containing protein [Candidatus Anstonellales archaeon]